MKKLSKLAGVLAILLALPVSCVKDDNNTLIIDPVYNTVGFYFLNEGQWGQNNATLEYFDYSTNTMTDGWWAGLNASVRGSLGDVGNDICVTGNHLLVLLNSSNLLEICDRSGRHLGEVEIPNCRMLASDGTYAYVTSYANDGYVAKVDIEKGKVVATCATGHEPEGLYLLNGTLYVLNSCGNHVDYYGGGNNEKASISVINQSTFVETERINLDIINAYSPLTLMPDMKSFFINSSGDYNSIAACSIIFDTESLTVTKTFDFGASSCAVYLDKLYILNTSYSYITNQWDINNTVYDIFTDSFSDFPVDAAQFNTFQAPSGLWIDPLKGDIFIADKGNYTSPGLLYRFDQKGVLKGKYDTGVCPGHLAWNVY